MTTASQVLTALVALLHVYFLVLEMFLWATPRGVKVFRRPLEELQQTRTLAANQGLYNGFVAAGLVWSLVGADAIAYDVRVFFLSFVVIAGIYGGLTAVRTILFAQALPGIAALAVTMLSR